MSLQTILNKYRNEVKGICADSRLIKPGDLFFALNHNYIDEVIEKGASIIICDTLPAKKYNIPVIEVKNLREKLGMLASEYFDHPSKKMNVIGVTGTNGKTSCTHFIAQAFQQAGLKSAVIGTIGNGPVDHLMPTHMTSPDALTLQNLFAQFVKEKIAITAMEVSSHGLDQNRLNGTHFKIGIFTNLTRDHLDYHQTMENYARAKLQLFERFDLKKAIFNLDDPYGFEWAHQFASRYKIIGITTKSLTTDIPAIYASNLMMTPTGLSAQVITPWGKGLLKTKLWGKFNLENLLCTLATLCLCDISLKDALSYIENIENVPGRMQLFRETNKPLVIVDYAHTPDALSKTLQAVREHCTGKLWCVFGCGGNRDKGKRPEMGKVAEMFADEIILTNDNPRDEDPLEIIAQIRQGISKQEAIISEPNRRLAISHAISCAKPQDVIVVAGKGHENYQEIHHEKIPYSDLLTVKMLLLEDN